MMSLSRRNTPVATRRRPGRNGDVTPAVQEAPRLQEASRPRSLMRLEYGLLALGYSWEEITRLKEEGAIL